MRTSDLIWVMVMGIAFWGCQDQQRAPLEPSGPPGFYQPDARIYFDMALPDGGLDESDSETVIEDAEVDSATFEVIPFAVETRVGERRTQAGIENRITCQVLDQMGEPILDIDARPEIHPDTGFERTEVGAIGQLARDYEIVCAANRLGLRDPTPAVWTVTPGAPERTAVFFDRAVIDAGEQIQIDCEAYDSFGNVVPDAPSTVVFNPPPRGLDRRGNQYRIDGAGTFAVSCAVPGAEETPATALGVQSGLPAAINISLFPERPVYRVGSVVEVVAQAVDIFGNPVAGDQIEFFSDPPLPTFGDGRFRLAQEGRYEIGARVLGPTWDGEALEQGVMILVDYGGPGIDCVFPEQGQMIPMPPDNVHSISGKVADIAGVEALVIDGVPVQVDANGNWRAEVPIRWGLNVHNIVASDGENETSSFCAYYAVDRFAAPDLPMMDAIALRVGQGAMDDGTPDAPLGSFADALRRMINSQGLTDTVHRAAAAQNPIVPNECRARILGICLFRLGVDYSGYENGGPNAFDLDLVDGGFRVRVALREQRVRAQLRGTLGNRARVRAEHITFDMTFDADLRNNGQPNIRLRSLNEVSVGDLDANFSGFFGFLLELVFEAFEGLIRNTVVDTLRDFLRDNVDRVLTDLLSNVDIGTLSQGFNIPSLTGGADIPLVVNASLSTLDFDNDRMMVGVLADVDGPLAIGDGGPGIPRLPGEENVQVPADRTVGAAVKLGLLNRIMYRLWRAGYFEAEGGGLVNNLADDLPDGTEVFLRFSQPPWVTGVAGEPTVRVFVGPLSVGFRHPDFFVEPVRVRVAVILEATLELLGERDIAFEDVRIDEFYLSLAGAEMPDQARRILEEAIQRVLQRIVDNALNDGLPVLPLPDFVVPDDLAEFNLPAGASLGLRQPVLTGAEAAWFFNGNFGE